MLIKSITRHAVALMALVAAGAAPAAAQTDFPTQPVTMVVPFAAGGSTDLVARIVAQRMSQELGQQVLVDNRGGAGGMLGAVSYTHLTLPTKA